MVRSLAYRTFPLSEGHADGLPLEAQRVDEPGRGRVARRRAPEGVAERQGQALGQQGTHLYRRPPELLLALPQHLNR